MLFVHNWLRAPYENWRDRRLWIRQGLPARRFPTFGRIDLDDLDWAREQACLIQPENASKNGVLLASVPDMCDVQGEPGGATNASPGSNHKPALEAGKWL